MLRRVLSAAAVLPLLSVVCLAQENLLERVPQLQEKARRANAGALGCGIGFIVLHTSRGPLVATGSADPVHVFGPSVHVSDLLTLLEARAEFNRTGAANPMSGEVSDLAYVTLYTLSLAQDPDAIPFIAELLKDKDEVVRGWAAIALYKLAEREELRLKVKEITFPQAAIHSAKSRGNEPPEWVRTAHGK